MKMFEITSPTEARIGETTYTDRELIAGCEVSIVRRGEHLINVMFTRPGHGTLSIGFGTGHACDAGETNAEVMFSSPDPEDGWDDVRTRAGIGPVSIWISQMLQYQDPDEYLSV